MVRSGFFHPNYIIKSINELLMKFYKKIAWNFEENEFNLIRQSLALHLSGKNEEVSSDDMFGNGINNNDLTINSIKLKHEALARMNLSTFVSMFFEYIIHERSKKMLLIVSFGKGRERNLKVDCNILYNKINQTIKNLDHTCL